MKDLGTLGGPDAFGIAINDRGQILGASLVNSTPNPTTGQPTGAAFLWDHGKVQVIPDPLGGTQISPYRLNNRGQVVGSANLAGDLQVHPFLWEKGVFTDLGTLGGKGGIAQEVNEAGQVTGTVGLPGDMIFHGFLWQNGVKSDLRPVASDPCSQTYGMNSSGQVVGWSGYFCPAGNFGNIRAVLWERGGSVIDLNTRLSANPHALYLFAATNINDHGEVVGEGVLPNGDAHSFLLIPCDENHVDGECEVGESAAAETQRAPAPATRPAATRGSLTPEGLAALRARMAHRYHIPGLGTPKD
jgi:probable HAF family extracellular repeat protein